MIDCLIVGAGISGLLAARKLTDGGKQVVVLDKGRGVGGRMATRRMDDGVFDHGAQFFTQRSERFGALVEAWLQAGLVRDWANGFANANGEWQQDGHTRYVGAHGMTTVPKHLAQGVNVRTSEKVVSIRLDHNTWITTTEAGEELRSQALLLTAPVPQSLALMDAGNYVLPAPAREALDAITYDPCIAVMALLDSAPNVPEPGGVQIDSEPIRWLAENHRKGISPAFGLTIHGASGFSREHFEGDRDAAGQLLLEAAASYLGDAKVIRYQVHGWRYSQPVHSYADPCLIVPGASPLLFAGDAFAGPRVEGAALSGLSAADYLLHDYA